MWHEFLAYIIIGGAFAYVAYRIIQSLRNPGASGTCSTCTEDCKLRGLKQPRRREKKKICKNKQEKRFG